VADPGWDDGREQRPRPGATIGARSITPV